MDPVLDLRSEAAPSDAILPDFRTDQLAGVSSAPAELGAGVWKSD